ncbi:MAG: hypothetical protein P8Y95_11780 [Gammaproteobacteria bacterium]
MCQPPLLGGSEEARAVRLAPQYREEKFYPFFLLRDALSLLIATLLQTPVCKGAIDVSFPRQFFENFPFSTIGHSWHLQIYRLT